MGSAQREAAAGSRAEARIWGTGDEKYTRPSTRIFQPECVIIRTSDFTNEGIEESRKHVLAGGAAIRGRQRARMVAGVCSSAATAGL